MDKNTVIGFFLMALVILGFSWLNSPSEEQKAAQRAERDRIEKAEKEKRKAQEADSIAQLQALLNQEPDTTVYIENELIKVGFGSRGGNINSAVLKNYFNYSKGNNDSVLVDLVNKEESSYGFVITTADRRFNTALEHFEPRVVNDSIVEMTLDFGKVINKESLPATVVDTLFAAQNDSAFIGSPVKTDPSNDKNSTFTIRYTLPKNSYIVSMEIIQQGMTDVVPAAVANADFNWNFVMMRNELGRTFEENKSSLTYKYVGDSPDEMSQTKKDYEDLNQKVKWIAFKNQFFSVISIPRTSFNSAKVKSEPLKDSSDKVKNMSYETSIDYSSAAVTPFAMDIYMGPNLYPLYSSLDDKLNAGEDLELTRLIPLGWPIIRWISTLIIIPTFTWLGTFISSYGLIILLLTIFIKLLIYPFTRKSLMSQAKMKVLAPEIKAINEKYPKKEDAMTRQQKTMALYGKYGASPMAGCLPMLLQMPVLIAMFWFFPSCIELRGQGFLWCHNLAAPDYICQLPFTIPFYGDKVSLFCLLMTVCNIVYTRINMQSQGSQNQMPGMKWMMYLMPVMFLCFFNDYAAGLSYYYLLSLLITIAMTYIFRAVVNQEKLRAKMEAYAADAPNRKKKGFMAKLEEAQKRQQAMLREQQKRRGR